MFKKIACTLCSAIVGSLLFFTASASAHVTVKPAESAAGSWETYTMKVPSEKNLPTTKVVLKMPKDVEFQQYEPIPGWKVSTQKHDDQSVSVTWEATDGGIQEGQFQRFTFVAKNPDKADEAAWDAYQYYKDGSIVEWTGDEDADTPHSITHITAAKQVTDEHGATKTEDDSKDTGSSALDITAIVLSAAAIILSVAALVKKKRA
ncbi:YcnI family copper-binding membrane protein [Bacillus vallismortis]|uniref:DUF1775 domain-containing protein n=1 Tax=Bacillus vallismortis TaxID=72361 RepID=A0AAP3CGB4_BACVA|nr:DUF1775 domain-containing protein [Bacillus vallismortis]MCY8309198.1 DUF1775 domain-containing protein [Bacillus vallismortis]MCY8315841.1 DUF1775 domain-containing protein [Bacillus vallismortis]MCY8596213.1 DUF1775 domain-containing protein [Bacillus vallismortis]MEC1650887.1 DUF1775 domain-containing protein [Bacillus vallismortis]MEC1790004.1 DUF1775 domain-containing protein [Bacillus vallismortis]